MVFSCCAHGQKVSMQRKRDRKNVRSDEGDNIGIGDIAKVIENKKIM